MKRFAALILAVIFSNLLHAQYNPAPAPQMDASYYSHKAKQQKTFATISLVTGGAVALVGGYIWFAAPIAGLSGSGEGIESARRTGQAMVGIGGGLIAISIPLFISSNRNKTKAELMMGTSQVNYLPSGSTNQLSVGLKVNF
jgi:hypothetical protein